MKFAIIATIAMIALLIVGGLVNHQIRVELGNAYGCGMVAERKFFRPPEDPIDIPERPWCADYRKLWENE